MPLSALLAAAADALDAVIRQGRSLTDVLARVDPALRPGVQSLAFHALRWQGGARAARKHLVSKAPAPAVDAVLQVALALLWPTGTDELPYAPHTLVDQAVQCVRRRHAPSAGFVNAVLRRFLRERDQLVPVLQARDEVARTLFPDWWRKKLMQDWPQQWEPILAASQSPAPMTLRVHAGRGSAEAYLSRLTEAGIAARVTGPQAVWLDQPCAVTRLPGFAQGDVSVQDLSAQWAAPLLVGQGADRLAPGSRVLDACAAPGGKTAHLLELMPDLHVTALDVDAGRLVRVEETLARLGAQARLIAADAARTDQWWDGQPFDAILLDAPCSASGIVRRHPDIRWLRRPEDVTALVRTQRGLLDALWPLLKPGGRLIYATCSVFQDEGEHQIVAFMQRTAGVIRHPAPGHLLPVVENAGASVADARAPSDGFYYARLDKPASAS